MGDTSAFMEGEPEAHLAPPRDPSKDTEGGEPAEMQVPLEGAGKDNLDQYSSAFEAYEKGAQPPLGLEPGIQRANSAVLRATVHLPQTYEKCGPSPLFEGATSQPRRVLTVPSEATKNDGADNENSDLILCVDDVLESSGHRYIVQDILGQGTFGQVAKCWCEALEQHVAIKIIKNQPAYYHQARMEICVLQLLNQRYDPDNERHIVRLEECFVHKRHLCLVFELLSVNLYELVKHNQFQGLSMNLLRVLMAQILDALVVLREARVIHCDLKPENVLLKGLDSGEIKVIDFGSACFENRTVYSYIQSRFYRSPEVLLGHPYTSAIDMWSFGCVAAEMFLGLPLFPGASEYDLLGRVIEMLGTPPVSLLAAAKNTSKYFTKIEERGGTGPRYQLLSQQAVEARSNRPAPLGKRYFKHTRLADIIGAYPMRSGMSEAHVARERQDREAFLDLLLGVLELDPLLRWSPHQAMQHPFITGDTFTGPFQPEPDPQPVSTGALQIPMGSPSHPLGSPAFNGGSAGLFPWAPGSGASLGASASSLGNSFSQLQPGSPASIQAQAHAAAMAVMNQLSPQMGSGPHLPGSFAGQTVGSGPGSFGQPASFGQMHSFSQQAAAAAAAAAAAFSPYGSLGAQPSMHGYGGYQGGNPLSHSLPGGYPLHQQLQHHHIPASFGSPTGSQAAAMMQTMPSSSNSHQQHGSVPLPGIHQQQQAGGVPADLAGAAVGLDGHLHPASLPSNYGSVAAAAAAHASAAHAAAGAMDHSQQQSQASSSYGLPGTHSWFPGMGTTPPHHHYMQGMMSQSALSAASLAAAMAMQNKHYTPHQAAVMAAAHAGSFGLAGQQLSHSYSEAAGRPISMGQLNAIAAASAAMAMHSSSLPKAPGNTPLFGFVPAPSQQQDSAPPPAGSGIQGSSVPLAQAAAGSGGMEAPGFVELAVNGPSPSAAEEVVLQGGAAGESSRRSRGLLNVEPPGDLGMGIGNAAAVFGGQPGEPSRDPGGGSLHEGEQDEQPSPEHGDLADYLPWYSDDQLIDDTVQVSSGSSSSPARPLGKAEAAVPCQGLNALALSDRSPLGGSSPLSSHGEVATRNASGQWGRGGSFPFSEQWGVPGSMTAMPSSHPLVISPSPSQGGGSSSSISCAGLPAGGQLGAGPRAAGSSPVVPAEDSQLQDKAGNG
mmetsp:Transcript_37239/g.105059  ORF Transcript_37239/g.105059 Transcript_37239/m.105059 type:complete len:1166 (-) Transcript_37239:1237-4734(-)